MSKEKNKLATKTSSLWKDFKAFITRGNILDMAVGVIIGGAFNAIVTAFTKILMSICTWNVPGGIDGLVTVLPATNASQSGAEFAGQFFKVNEVTDKVIEYAQKQGAGTINVQSDTYLQWKDSLLKNYTLHGDTYTYNSSSIIDWGTFINAIITFFIIALTLFVIVKVVKSISAKRLAIQKDLEEKAHQAYLKEHPEEAEKERKEQEEKNKPAPKPDNILLLEEIRDEIKKLNEKEETTKEVES